MPFYGFQKKGIVTAMKVLLLNKKELRKNRKKGFTLVELIVVIVVLAILIAALVPAILGIIDRANRMADEAFARALFTAGNVASIGAEGGAPRAPIFRGIDRHGFGGNAIMDGVKSILDELSVAPPSHIAYWAIWYDGVAVLGVQVLGRDKEPVCLGITPTIRKPNGDWTDDRSLTGFPVDMKTLPVIQTAAMKEGVSNGGFYSSDGSNISCLYQIKNHERTSILHIYHGWGA